MRPHDMNVPCLFFPIFRIISDIFGNSIISILIPNQTIIKSGLPTKIRINLPGLFGDGPFQPSNNRRQIFGLGPELILGHRSGVF